MGSVNRGRRLRLGMVGGGPGAFIGAVHRIAARMDDRYELVAGACRPIRRRREGVRGGAPSPLIDMANYAAMAKAECTRADGIDAVAIVTPNNFTTYCAWLS